MGTTRVTVQRSALALLAAAALLGVVFGVAQVLRPSTAVAQVATDSGVAAASTLSATGVGQISGDAAEARGALMMTVQEQSAGTDVQAAVKSVQDRIAQLRAALTAAGVPGSAIQTQGFNVGPMYGYPMPTPLPIPPAGESGGGAVPARPVGPPPVSGYMVNAQIMVETAGPEQLATVMRVAIDNGATNVNSFFKGGPGNQTPPDVARLVPAIREATEQAKVMAQASAEAAGVTLGGIHSVTVLPPTPSFGGGGPVPTTTWQVQVKVTYQLR